MPQLLRITQHIAELHAGQSMQPGQERSWMQHRLQAKLAKVILPFSLLAIYVVWMQSRSDRVVSPFQ